MKNNFEESPDYQEYNHFLSKQLVKIRKEIGWSQKDVAEAMGITLRTEQNFEYCRRRLSRLRMFQQITSSAGRTISIVTGTHSEEKRSKQ